jgi:hypothetical protein
VLFWPWRAAVVSPSPERGWNGVPPITDELTSVLAFHGQHAFALGTVIALAEYGEKRSCRHCAEYADEFFILTQSGERPER